MRTVFSFVISQGTDHISMEASGNLPHIHGGVAFTKCELIFLDTPCRPILMISWLTMDEMCIREFEVIYNIGYG